MTIPNYIVIADVTARMSTDNYLRLVDRNGTGSADTTFLQQCIDDACSQWNIWMGDALAGDWTASGHVVDGLVKRRLVGLACAYVCDAYPGGVAATPYENAEKAAEKLASDLRKGHVAKLVTSAVTTAKPAAGTVTVGASGNTDDSDASEYVRAANGSLGTGF